MLKVLVTVDTEVHSISSGWKEDHLLRDIRRDLYGEIGHKRVGLRYQLDTFERFGIKATFMMESLFSAAPEVGPEPLANAIRMVWAAGQDVQLHLHPEWIPFCPDLGIEFRSHLMHAYSLEEQTRMIGFAKERLVACGAPQPIAFRAGGFAADENTLRALAACGIRFDSSFNVFYENGKCKLPTMRVFGTGTESHGVMEIPVAAFVDYPNHFRHAQLCACSTQELTHALEQAERKGWDFFVIVSHSFEMVTRRWHASKRPLVRERVVRRFEEMCSFLSQNRDRFQTVGFAELGQENVLRKISPRLLGGNVLHTANRLFEQATNRLRLKFQ